MSSLSDEMEPYLMSNGLTYILGARRLNTPQQRAMLIDDHFNVTRYNYATPKGSTDVPLCALGK